MAADSAKRRNRRHANARNKLAEPRLGLLPRLCSGQPTERNELMLRRISGLKRLRLAVRDGDIGRVKDFLVDTRNWWPGRKVLLSPRWIASIDWHRSAVGLNPNREAIRRHRIRSEPVRIPRVREPALRPSWSQGVLDRTRNGFTTVRSRTRRRTMKHVFLTVRNP
jgi:hypothetical protein